MFFTVNLENRLYKYKFVSTISFDYLITMIIYIGGYGILYINPITKVKRWLDVNVYELSE